MFTLPLDHEWIVHARARADGVPVPAGLDGRFWLANLPASARTVLQGEGALPAWNRPDAEARSAWVGEVDWVFQRSFHWPETAAKHARAELRIPSVDTVAEIWLDSTLLTRTANQFIPLRLALPAGLGAGEHCLKVIIRSPLAEAREAESRLGARPHWGRHPFNALRKMGCGFGWNWAPCVADSGLSAGIELRAWDGPSLTDWRHDFELLPDGAGRLRLRWEWTGEPDAAIEHSLLAPDGAPLAATELRHGPGWSEAIHVLASPALWWPRGQGAQPLYRLVLTSPGNSHGEFQLGLRTLALDTSPIEGGGAHFRLVVNGRPVRMLGFNWVPPALELPRADDPVLIAARLADIAEAGGNAVRVWGGGRYETDEFYAQCDRLGILVWQDFAFACAFYSEEPALRDNVLAEAESQIRRLRHRASLALWCGGNEIFLAWDEFSNQLGPWRETLGDRTWGEGYFLRDFPRLLNELDSTRPYWPGTPWTRASNPGEGPVSPNIENEGTQHIWGPWATGDANGFLATRPRFVAEFGLQAPSTPETIAEALAGTPMTQALWTFWQREVTAPLAWDRWAVRAAARDDGPPPASDYAARVLWLQRQQAEGLETALRHFLADPDCGGVLIWQLAECWPGHGWGLVDCAGRRKPAWEAVRRAFLAAQDSRDV